MREFRQDKGRAAKTQVWRIARSANNVMTEWGVLDGKMQNTEQTFEAVNVGKSNEKDPSQVAQEFMDRQILLRKRKGWVEFTDGQLVKVEEEAPAGIDWDGDLPQNMRLWKPQNSLDPKSHMAKVIAAKKALWTRKRDGNQHTLYKGANGEWRLYSSTMQPSHKDEMGKTVWLDRYPKLRAALERWDVPPCSIFSGELVVADTQDDDGFDVDDLLYVGSIVKSKTDLALEKQGERSHLTFCVFDIIYWGGEAYFSDMTVGKRLGKIHQIVTELNSRYISHVEILMKGKISHADGTQKFPFDGSQEGAIELAKERDWEGFVCLDPDGTYEDKGVNFAGKPQRPKFAVKVKPKFEADFIVLWEPEYEVKVGGKKTTLGTWGKGRKSIGVGAVFAFLVATEEYIAGLDTKKREEFDALQTLLQSVYLNAKLPPLRYISKVGGGLTMENVKKFADEDLYPMVWQVEFASWTPDGSIQFPEFIRVRDEEKKAIECTMDQMPKEVR